MKIKTFLLIFLTIRVWVPAAPALPAASAQKSLLPASKKETTIRNLTKETVRYTIRRLMHDQQPIVRYLKPDALDRWPCESPLDVSFERSGQPASYRLECGLPYSFRYDEDDNLDLYSGSHGLFGVADLAPFVPTPMVVVDKMLELGEVDENDLLFDLGCGDGRIVITAAQKYGTRGVGIDIDPQRIEESLRAAKEAGVDGLVDFRLQDVMKADIREATVVTLYLLPESNALLRPLLEEQLKPGTPVVSHNYSIPGWESKEVAYITLQDGTGQDHTIFAYKR